VLRDLRHGFLGLCIDAGRRTLAAMAKADRVALCGANGVPTAGRRAVRGGSAACRVVAGSQHIAVRRLRPGSLDAGELALPRSSRQRPVYNSLTALRSGSFLKSAKDNSCGSAS
jgi:hypothetical protein